MISNWNEKLIFTFVCSPCFSKPVRKLFGLSMISRIKDSIYWHGTGKISSFLNKPLHIYTRWFKYDRDKCGLFTHKSVPVIFEPPCTYIHTCISSTHDIFQGGFGYETLSDKKYINDNRSLLRTIQDTTDNKTLKQTWYKSRQINKKWY